MVNIMLDNLNEKQQEAVKETEGAVLVLAGAGSGKTKVLTTRVAYLINEKGVNPRNILAITFTNKAATEMKERISKMVENSNKIQISTYHSLGLLFIRENCEKLNYQSNFTILDSEDALTLIKKIMKEKGIDDKAFNPRAIRNAISSAKNELIDAKSYEKYALTEFEKKVYEVYLN